MVGIFPVPGILNDRIKDKNIFMAKEPQYKLRAMVHNFSQLPPWSGPEPQSRSDSRSVCGEVIPGPSLAHAQSRQEVLSGACSAVFSSSSTNPVMSQKRQHREVQDWPLEQLRK